MIYSPYSAGTFRPCRFMSMPCALLHVVGTMGACLHRLVLYLLGMFLLPVTISPSRNAHLFDKKNGNQWVKTTHWAGTDFCLLLTCIFRL